MYYVGVDLHKEKSWFCVLDENGSEVSSKSISNSPEVLKAYFEEIPKPFTLAVETTYNWYFFVDLAEQYAEKVYLANSYELKAFAKRNKKTDKIDSRLIATVLYKGYLPTVTIPDKKTRDMRELLRYRMNLVQDRTRTIARLKIMLDKLGEPSVGNLTTYKGLKEISYAHLSDNYRKIIAGYIEKAENLARTIYDINTFIKQKACEDGDILNLTTIPGLDYFSASLVKSEIIDINRFQCFDRLCAYAGLAPRVSQSGNKSIRGPLNKNRRKHLRWILLEVAYHFIKSDRRRELKHQLLTKRKGFNTAKVILARDMLKVIYHVLKERRSYYREGDFKIRSEAAPALVGA